MSDDPAKGLDPKDVEELERLFQEISAQHRAELTDDVGLTDQVWVQVHPETAVARGTAPSPRVVTVSGTIGVSAHVTGEVVVSSSGVDPSKMKRMLRLAGLLAQNVGAAIVYDVAKHQFASYHEQVESALKFVQQVLDYLRDLH